LSDFRQKYANNNETMALKYSWAISYVPALKTYTISKTWFQPPRSDS